MFHVRLIRLGCCLVMFVALHGQVAAAEESTTISVADGLLDAALQRAGGNREQIKLALDTAPEEHRDAVRFLVAYMPDRDLSGLSAQYILTNVDLAYRAREATAWGARIPNQVFFNDVLPYASVNERRDDWRAEFFERCLPLVRECQTLGEVAQVLNRDLFKLLDVQYHASKRPKPDQSPRESIEAKYASCSGLSILLIDACRAVCVPARFVGTPRWTTKRGNHSWVEVWSDGHWHFTGACEYDARGLDRGWFTADASQAIRDDPRHAIFASSWQTTGTSFPLVWARRDRSVPAVNVTARYTKTDSDHTVPDGKVLVGIDVWPRGETERVSREVVIRSVTETLKKARTTGSGNDANDRLEVVLQPDTDYKADIRVDAETTQTRSFRTMARPRQLIKLVIDSTAVDAGALGSLRDYLDQARGSRLALAEQPFSRVSLSRVDAEEAARLLWKDQAAWIRQSRAAEMEKREFTLNGKALKFHYTVYGEKPKDGRSLYISLHGGGNAPPGINDRQWKNQQKLYEPSEGVYLAPRAPTNTWNLWHEPHIDPMFDRLINNLMIFEDVNPNRVYLMGYSAGGDGVYQLAPRMADRWAATAMMAGHPNEASPLGLLNIGFALHVGAEDGAYNRNQVAGEWADKLAALRQQHPDGYQHQVEIHAGKGHWMDRQDAVAVPWMANFVRDVRPRHIVWYQDDVTHGRFYWLAVAEENRQAGALVKADREGQTIDIQTEEVKAIAVLLDDQMLDLDKPVTIRVNGQERFSGPVQRTIAALARSLTERSDPTALFYSRVSVER